MMVKLRGSYPGQGIVRPAVLPNYFNQLKNGAMTADLGADLHRSGILVLRASSRTKPFARLWHSKPDKVGAPNNLGLERKNRQWCASQPGRERFAISLGRVLASAHGWE